MKYVEFQYVSLLFVIKLWETNYDGPRTDEKLNKITKNSVTQP